MEITLISPDSTLFAIRLAAPDPHTPMPVQVEGPTETCEQFLRWLYPQVTASGHLFCHQASPTELLTALAGSPYAWRIRDAGGLGGFIEDASMAGSSEGSRR